MFWLGYWELLSLLSLTCLYELLPRDALSFSTRYPAMPAWFPPPVEATPPASPLGQEKAWTKSRRQELVPQQGRRRKFSALLSVVIPACSSSSALPPSIRAWP